MKRVLVDMDGVLSETLSPWLAAWNAQYGSVTDVFLSRDDITEYEFDRFVPEKHRQRFFALLHDFEVFADALPELGAIAAMRKLLASGLDVVIVTTVLADCPSGEQQKRAWLRRWLPEFNQKNLIFTARKELVRGDVLIEDCEANIARWRDANNYGWAFLVKQPYTPHGHASLATIVDAILRGSK